jgi:hypothetical protein
MLNDEIRQILLEELTALRERIIQNMGRADQIVTGRTRDSLTVTTGEQPTGAFGVLTGRQAFATLETGSRPWSRPPAKVPKFFADLIGEWIDAKGLDLNKWAVAHTIIHKGSKLYRTGGRADIYTPEIAQTMENLGDRILERYSVLITDRLNFNTTIKL